MQKYIFCLLMAFALGAGLSAQRRLVHIDTVYAEPYYSSMRVGLHWKASHDFGLLGYHIERSEDRRDWKKIHWMPNTTLTDRRSPEVPYLWLDTQTKPGKVYWYRLRCVAEDGHYTYLYPSVPYPRADGIWLEEQVLYGEIIFVQNYDNEVFERAEIKLYDVAGREVLALENLELPTGIVRITLGQRLEKGTYKLVLRLADGRRWQQKIIVF